ncbi:hypothetical protein [Streptosporangium roseum]|uniref:hypothetical protein n=1 Tax=Streptosporangium roseum TaxID=2001 RepID=UPI003320C216
MSISPLDDTVLAREYAAGKTIRDLARSFGCSQKVIFDRLAAADLVRLPRAVRRLTSKERRQVITAYRSGKPLKDIAATFGVTPTAVRQIAVAAGVPGRPNGGPRELDYRRIHALAAKGMSAEKIAAKVGSTPGWIKSLLRNLRDADPALLSASRKHVHKRYRRGFALDLDMDAIAAQYAAGTLVTEIARTHGCSVPLLYQRLRRAGIPADRQGKSRIEARDDIVAAYVAGWSMLDICATFGVNNNTVERLASEAGVERRPSGAPRVTDWDAVIRMADDGHPSKEIAAKVGCTSRQVARVLRKHDYTWNGRRWCPPANATAPSGRRKPTDPASCAP